jgi:putative iron-regulated protein
VPFVLAAIALAPLAMGIALVTPWRSVQARPLADDEASAVLRQYADIAHASYGDAADAARVLASAVDAFVDAPSAERLATARKAWLASRIPYMQTEVFRFYGGPIDAVETLINTWPIDESYVESEDGKSGIVTDTLRYPSLTADLLASLNLKDGETSVSTGYHAIEFLLWGRDTSLDGPGQRSFLDYVSDGNQANGAARRAAYLRLVTGHLVAQLENLERAWAPDVSGNYRTHFLGLDSSEALALVIKGMGTLSGVELAGERLTVPYETKDQENEHSCFSDATRDDVAYDALGLLNICKGQYRGTRGRELNGPGVCHLVASVDEELGDQLEESTAASVEAVRQIPDPFDRALLGSDSAQGRQTIRRSIAAFRKQAELLARASVALGAGPANGRTQ